MNLELIFSNPEKYFCSLDGRYWPETEFTNAPFPNKIDDIYIKYDNEPIAYIHNIEVRENERFILIGHFAVDPNQVKTGIALKIAKSFANQLLKKYDIDYILFDETRNSIRHDDFFSLTLGAVEADSILSPGDKAWKWNLS